MPRALPSSSAPQLKLRLRMACGSDDAFGPGKAQLLESLLETASLNQTASALKMSYVKALALVRSMNTHFREPLVVLSRGGVKGGGTQVTPAGNKVLAEYHTMCAASEAAAQPLWRRLRKYLRE